MFQKLLDLIRWVEEEYGLRLVTWTFGSWKTKNTFREAFLWKLQNPYWIIISNIPYKDFEWNDLVDISFDSKDDLRMVLNYVFDYLRDTNTFDILKEWLFVPIKIIIDEAHLYYFSRNFKSFDMEMMTILTQCRKRLVSIYFITQELNQIDKFLRRLSPEVIEYRITSLGLVRKDLYYFKSTEQSDINDVYNVELLQSKLIWWDKLVLFFTPKLKNFFEQRFLTYYICWAKSTFSMSYYDFLNFIKERKELILSLETK